MRLRGIFLGFWGCLICFHNLYTQDSTIVQLDEVQVTANRTEQVTSDVPASIEIIGKEKIKSQVFQNTDGILNQYSGINVFRPLGIFGHSNVGLRGITGIEQGRVLVLEDGVPVNVSDLGRVNWNRFNPLALRQIEVIRGPGSSIYGGNAMGGVINMISRQADTSRVSGSAIISYATYNTISGAINLNSKPLPSSKLYVGLNAFYRQSDGYVNQPDSLRDTTHIAAWLKEYAIGLKAGYFLNPDQRIELNYDFYNDRRSQGEQILHPDGNFTDHDTHFLSGKYSGEHKDFKWNVQLYYQQELYFRNAESFKKSYSLFYVNAKREDMGILSSLSYKTKRNLLTGGLDFKRGRVDGADEYQTSSDVVRNQGEMDRLALYLTEQYKITRQLQLTASVHFTHANLKYAKFSIENNSGHSDILLPYQNDTSGQQWNRLSPRIALQYSTGKFRVYGSFSTGFRPPTLDDLTRSGYIAGAFKVANPALRPEYVHTYETGMMFQNSVVKLSLSGYITTGFDFLYYIETGESMGRRPIVQKQNITGVNVIGSEFSLEYKISRHFDLNTNIAFNSSTISRYPDHPELEGKILTYTPELMANLGITYTGRYLNASANAKYTGEQYLDDANTMEIPGVVLLNMKLWYDFRFGLHLAVSGENLLDQRYLVYYDQLSVGRFISATVGFRF